VVIQKLSDVYFPNTTTGFAVGDSGTILKTSDSGMNWAIQSSGINEKIMLFFLLIQHGLCCWPPYNKTTNGHVLGKPAYRYYLYLYDVFFTSIVQVLLLDRMLLRERSYFKNHKCRDDMD